MISFKEDYTVWMEHPFGEQDAEEIEKKTRQYEITINDLKNKLGRNNRDEVLDKLAGNVREITNMMGSILDLGNKALRPRHWNDIFHYASDENYRKGHDYKF